MSQSCACSLFLAKTNEKDACFRVPQSSSLPQSCTKEKSSGVEIGFLRDPWSEDMEMSFKNKSHWLHKNVYCCFAILIKVSLCIRWFLHFLVMINFLLAKKSSLIFLACRKHSVSSITWGLNYLTIILVFPFLITFFVYVQLFLQPLLINHYYYTSWVY